MIVYHASNVMVQNPDTAHSRDFLDFGRGFYLTSIKEQAVKYGNRFHRRGTEAWLNVYELDEDWDRWKVLTCELLSVISLNLQWHQSLRSVGVSLLPNRPAIDENKKIRR